MPGRGGANTRGLRGLWSRVLNNQRLERAAQTVLNRAHGTSDRNVDERQEQLIAEAADQNCGSATTVMAWPEVRLLTWWSQVCKRQRRGSEWEIEAWEVGPGYEKGEWETSSTGDLSALRERRWDVTKLIILGVTLPEAQPPSSAGSPSLLLPGTLAMSGQGRREGDWVVGTGEWLNFPQAPKNLPSLHHKVPHSCRRHLSRVI